MEKYTSKDIIERLEILRGKTFEQLEKDDIVYWQKCRDLANTFYGSGWQVALELLQGYVVNAVERLVEIDPSETANAAAQHAVAHVASHMLRIFTEDVQKMVSHARETPRVVRETVETQIEL